MFYAIDKNTKKIVQVADANPFTTYICPSCEEEVIIKGGDTTRVKKHFSHKKGMDCDTFKHDNSDWRSKMLKSFPSCFKEVTLRVNLTQQEIDAFRCAYIDTSYASLDIPVREASEKYKKIVHRADILLPANLKDFCALREGNTVIDSSFLIDNSYDLPNYRGTVIEFQHNKISSEEFAERNLFYNACGYHVVWVFDMRKYFDKSKIVLKSIYNDTGRKLFRWNAPLDTFDGFQPQLKPMRISIYFLIDDFHLNRVVWCPVDQITKQVDWYRVVLDPEISTAGFSTSRTLSCYEHLKESMRKTFQIEEDTEDSKVYIDFDF